MVVDVVDVDQFPSLYDVADYAGGERKSHLILLKIQNSAVERERESGALSVVQGHVLSLFFTA